MKASSFIRSLFVSYQSETEFSIMSKASKTTYGAVEADENAAVDHSFDAESAYYLKSETATLTPRQRTRKYLSTALPILVAVLIMGGLAWLLLRDFNNLYPGRGGGSGDDSTIYDRSIPTTGKNSLKDSTTIPGTTPSRPDSSSVKHVDSSLAACSVHAACAKLELVGNCCPTDEGVVLGCC